MLINSAKMSRQQIPLLIVLVSIRTALGCNTQSFLSLTLERNFIDSTDHSTDRWSPLGTILKGFPPYGDILGPDQIVFPFSSCHISIFVRPAQVIWLFLSALEPFVMASSAIFVRLSFILVNWWEAQTSKEMLQCSMVWADAYVRNSRGNYVFFLPRRTKAMTIHFLATNGIAMKEFIIIF